MSISRVDLGVWISGKKLNAIEPTNRPLLTLLQKQLNEVRYNLKLFNFSHITIRWYGKDAAKFLEKLVVGDIQGLKVGESKLSLIMNENGGIVDDTVITNAGSHM